MNEVYWSLQVDESQYKKLVTYLDSANNTIDFNKSCVIKDIGQDIKDKKRNILVHNSARDIFSERFEEFLKREGIIELNIIAKSL